MCGVNYLVVVIVCVCVCVCVLGGSGVDGGESIRDYICQNFDFSSTYLTLNCGLFSNVWELCFHRWLFLLSLPLFVLDLLSF